MNTTGITNLKPLDNRISICMLLITAFFVFSLIQTPDTYADKKKITGTSKGIKTLARTRVPIPKTPQKGYLTVNNLVLNSSDPDWNNARFFFIRYAASAGEWGNKAYGVITHPNGDQSFISLKEKLTGSGSVYGGEVKGYFLNGTGKFKGIKGNWNSNWKMDQVREETWQIEYEVK